MIRDIGSSEIGKEIKNETALQKKDIEEGQAAYIQEQVAVQLKSRVQEELIETYGVQIHHINLSVEQSKNREVSISSAEVFLEQADPEKNHTATGGEHEQPVRPIEEVTVAVEPKDTSDSGSGQESVDNSRILSFLAGRWEMDKKFISLRMEGGT
ncbi:stage III sporulation protein AF [Sporolactobacillus sp. Y61]|uniref:Stage III sporulation protein AF n=1 Tax=Sporolactobacillus sp. Y61 TaxID=3160863 RepID=A0AAU8IJT2_9BACL